MRIIGAILAAIAGGIFSYFLVGFVAMALMEAAGASNINGGLAMGVFFGIAPIGTIIGAILGALMVLRAPSVDKDTQALQASSQSNTRPDADTNQSETPQTKSNGTRDGIIVFAILGALIYGLYAYFLKEESPPPSFAQNNAPIVEFEIRAPANSIQKADQFFKTRLDLRSWYHEFYLGSGEFEDIGDGMVVVRGKATLRYRHTDRWIKFNPADSTLVTFKLNYPDKPKKEDQFGPWQKLHEFSRAISGDLPYDKSNFHIRTRVR